MLFILPINNLIYKYVLGYMVTKMKTETQTINRPEILASLLESAKTRHPHSGDLCRWSQVHYRGKSAGRVCNLCEREISGSSFDKHYPRTNKSVAAEEAHIQWHIDNCAQYSYAYIKKQKVD